VGSDGACCAGAGFRLLVRPGVQEQLEHILSSRQPSVRMRGLSLLAGLASAAPDNLHALHTSGRSPCPLRPPCCPIHIKMLHAQLPLMSPQCTCLLGTCECDSLQKYPVAMLQQARVCRYYDRI
jgi:hypothetical protein